MLGPLPVTVLDVWSIFVRFPRLTACSDEPVALSPQHIVDSLVNHGCMLRIDVDGYGAPLGPYFNPKTRGMTDFAQRKLV